VKAICEAQPPRPSAAVKQADDSTALSEFERELRGDLDNIVLKALHKEPPRRDASALELADDIERYLAGKPVGARQDTAWYRTGKFVRRHKVAVTMAALSITVLVTAFAVTAIQYRVAERERRRAQERFNDVRQLANTFIFDIHDGIRSLAGATAARQKLAETASRYLDNLAKESEHDRALQKELAAAYGRLSDIQGGIAQANTGDSTASRESLRRAVALREAVAKADPNDAENSLEWAASLANLGISVSGPEGLQMAQKAVAIADSVYSASPSLAAGEALATAYGSVGVIYLALGKMEEAIGAFNSQGDRIEALIRQTPANGGLYLSLALVSKRIGAIQGTRSNFAEAFTRYRRALEIEQEFIRYNPLHIAGPRAISVTYSDLGWLSNRSGDRKAAMENYKKALEIRQRLADADATDVDAKGRLAVTLDSIGSLLKTERDWSQAESYFRKEFALFEQILQKDPANPKSILAVAAAHTQLGSVALGSRNFDQALEHGRRALALANDAAAKKPQDRQDRSNLAGIYGDVGTYYSELASHRASDTARCQMLEPALDSLNRAIGLLLGMKQTGPLTNSEDTDFANYSSMLKQTEVQLAQRRRAGSCPRP
jgi:non-specific serine/threonine protein kinase/serine/threonine-protein kinase